MAALLSAAAACGGGPAPGSPAPDGLEAWLRVENQSYRDFNMYVWRHESRQRLGRSTANTTVTFRLPPALLAGAARLRFSADPVGRAEGGLTREIAVAPGDTVIMIIPPS